MAARVQTSTVRLLGYPTLRLDQRDCPVGLKHLLALAAVLVEAPGPVARTKLAGLLWPDVAEETARTRLRRLLYRLAQLLDEGALSVHGEAVAFNFENVDADSRRFRARAEEGLAKGDIAALEEADALYGAEFLCGFELASSQPFEDWASGVRMELARLKMRTLRALSEHHLAAGAWERALAAAGRLIALDPLQEGSHCLVFRAHHGAGDQSALAQAYRSCVETLRRELGVAPSEATQAVYHALLSRGTGEALRAKAGPPPIRFARTPSGSVAYAAIGDGVPIIIIPGFVSHVEIAWEEPRLREFLTRLSETNRVIMFDRRGLGLSERVGMAPTIEAGASDIEAILDAERIERALLFGASEGGPIAIRLAVSRPQRVAGLVLYGTLACGGWREDYPWALKEDTFRGWSKFVLSTWGTATSIEMFAPSVARDAAERAWWARTLRTAATPAAMADVLDALFRIDVRADLKAVRALTVVLHRKGDLIVRFGGGEYLAGQIPGAKFMALEGNDHWWWIGDYEPILKAIANVCVHPTASLYE